MDAAKGVMRMNCKNCGAPMQNGRCEYCGTQAEKKTESRIEITADGIRLICTETDDGGEKTGGN